MKTKIIRPDIANMHSEVARVRKKKDSDYVVTLSQYPLSRKRGESYHSKYKVNYVPSEIPEINALAEDMVEWAFSNPDAYAIEDFPVSHCMSPTRFYRCAERSEYFKDALEIAKYAIGLRLQKGAREGRIDKQYVLKILPMYHPEFSTLTMSRFKAFKDSLNSGTLKVIVEPFVTTSAKLTEDT